jgi:uncharacterized protein DUF6968
VDQPIATLSLLGRLADTQKEFPVQVSIGKPYSRDNGSWACPVELEGIHDRIADIVGDDSLQALCLAVQFAGKLLAAFLQRGGRLRSSGDDPEDWFPLEAYFGASGSSNAGGAA